MPREKKLRSFKIKVEQQPDKNVFSQTFSQKKMSAGHKTQQEFEGVGKEQKAHQPRGSKRDFESENTSELKQKKILLCEPNGSNHIPIPSNIHNNTTQMASVVSFMTPAVTPRKKREFSQEHKDKLKLGKILAKRKMETKVKQQLVEIVTTHFTPKLKLTLKKAEVEAIEQLETLMKSFLNGQCLKEL